jgi:hypothetical protein
LIALRFFTRRAAERCLRHHASSSRAVANASYGIASYYAVIRDNDRALDWLEKAYSERDGTLVWLKVHPRLDGLREEPRFRDLLARLQLDSRMRLQFL